MIHITQGHEGSIALEVFLKSFLLLSPSQQQSFTLHCNEQSWKKNLQINNLRSSSFSNLMLVFTKAEPQSSAALLSALELLEAKQDILLTLPTSKDQLIYKETNYAGHTEFLRAYCKSPEASMLFASSNKRIVLMSDHIPLKEVPNFLSSQKIVNKISNTLEGHGKYFYDFEEVIISGINPHAGENGLLGSEESEILNALIYLKEKYPKLNFIGPLPGDTLHTAHKEDKKQLLVYMHHDQGLAPFKLEFGFIGLNISLGLPFLRMSVDHGTAFPLFGKGQANCLGCHYMLKSALQVHNQFG